MRPFLLLFSLLILGQARAQTGNVPDTLLPSAAEMARIKAANIKKAAATQFQYFIIRTGTGQYGYSIYADGNLYIQQTTIPALPGNKGFADTTSAGKLARLVIQKIREGELPPTIRESDLKKLNILQ